MKSISVLIFALFAFVTVAQNVTQWRGNDRTGIYNEKGLLEEWPASGPKLAWHFDELGKGFSSVAVYDGNVYTTGMEGSAGFLYCLDKNGKLIWKKNYGEEWTVNFPGSRTTPTIDNGKIYVISTPGLASCFNTKDGSIIWQKDLAELYAVQIIRFGNSESPLIVDDKVIFTTGGTEITIVALDKNTGENIWVNKRNGETSAYCSPLLINHNGNKIIVTSIEKNIIGLSAVSGKTLWTYPQTNQYNIHPNTPIYDGINIYSITGYGKGGTMIKLSDDGSSVTLGWQNTSLDNQMGGVVLIDGKIYGSGQNNKDWQCLDAKTGKVLYKSGEVGNGTVIYNEGLLYCYSQNGKVSILKPTANGFEIKGSVKVELGSDQHWAHPVICNGILYIRHGNALLAYNIKK